MAGGGAKGAAHVGVLKVLEELRVPIDCIAGTSMGAVVGGLYAAGLSPREIETQLTQADWVDLFEDRPPRRDLPYRRKQDDANFLIRFALGIKEGRLVLPKGLIQGRKLRAMLRTLTVSRAEVRDFDELATPFRAVAADIETGETVVLGRGDLAAAILASMSIPGVFPPVELDGRLLVDGGIANNTPVDVARAMGAEILIVVDLPTPLRKRQELRSAIEISQQALDILAVQNTKLQMAALKSGDVVIRPELAGIMPGDYHRAVEAVRRGEAAARRSSEEVSRLSLNEGNYRSHLAVKRGGPDTLPVIGSIRIVNPSRLDPAVIRSKIRTPVGRPLEVSTLKEDLARVNGLDYFEQVEFDLEKTGGTHGLVFKAEEKSWGPHYIRFGLNLADDFSGGTSYALAARETTTLVNRLGAEWRNEMAIGDEPRISSEFYQPLDAGGRFFASASAEHGQANVEVFRQGNRVSEFRDTATTAGLDLGRQLENWGELRVGARHGDGDLRPRFTSGTLGGGGFEEGGYLARFSVDTIDNPHFPRSGTAGEVEFRLVREELGAESSYDVLNTQWFQAMSFGPNTFLLSARIGSVLNKASQVEDRFSLGGFLSLSGLDQGQLSGQHVGLGRLVYYRQFFKPRVSSYEIPLYLGGSLEAGNTWNDRSQIHLNSLRWAGSTFLGLDTFLGPLYLAYGFTEDDQDSAYLFLGQTF
ncbi:MAG: patatin-like phospholipase family protein [Candidatus Omnitrophica bacterium]|nr:patatin-like phospholipase family protein [Candidatus Omnitrophota bacterium]